MSWFAADLSCLCEIFLLMLYEPNAQGLYSTITVVRVVCGARNLHLACNLHASFLVLVSSTRNLQHVHWPILMLTNMHCIATDRLSNNCDFHMKRIMRHASIVLAMLVECQKRCALQTM